MNAKKPEVKQQTLDATPKTLDGRRKTDAE
jgi:hypothetical protein